MCICLFSAMLKIYVCVKISLVEMFRTWQNEDEGFWNSSSGISLCQNKHNPMCLCIS